VLERGAERAAELLASHQVPPLSPRQLAEMERVIRAAEREAVK
jgi:hypothetical protein